MIAFKREVFAVPGSVFAAGSEGTHRLIQDGAKLVHDVNDILKELPGHLHLPQTAPEEPEPPLRALLALISREEPTHIDARREERMRDRGATAPTRVGRMDSRVAGGAVCAGSVGRNRGLRSDPVVRTMARDRRWGAGD